MTKLNKTFLFLNLAFVAAIITVGAVLAWTGPAASPPTGSGLFYYSGSNVGVGITNPGQKLSVAGTVESTSGGFKFPDGTTQASAASGNGGSFWATSSGNVIYNTNTGNVGIGTTTPTQKLSVAGTVESTSGGFKFPDGTIQTTAATGGGGGGGGNTVSLLHFNGTDSSTVFTDSGVDGLRLRTWTANGNVQIDTAQSKFSGASALFDGSGDYLAAHDSDDWNFGSGDFTIDGWVRFNVVPSDPVQYAQWGEGWWTGYINFNWMFGSSTNDIHFLFDTAHNYNVPYTWAANTWYHIAVVKSGNNLYFFVNGTQAGTTQNCPGTTTGSVFYPLQIGVTRGGGSGAFYYFNGWMDEMRISKGIARWTSNFTPPTAEY